MVVCYSDVYYNIRLAFFSSSICSSLRAFRSVSAAASSSMQRSKRRDSSIRALWLMRHFNRFMIFCGWSALAPRYDPILLKSDVKRFVISISFRWLSKRIQYLRCASSLSSSNSVMRDDNLQIDSFESASSTFLALRRLIRLRRS